MSLAGTVLELLGRPESARVLGTGLLVAARLAPLTVASPILGLRSAAPTIRAVVLLALTAVLVPVALPSAIVPDAGLLPLAILREALVGSLFALACAIPFHALEAGGRLVDLHRGANLAEVIAPPTGERTSPLGDLALLAGLALFAAAGGVRLTIGTFADGLVDLPVGAADATGRDALGLARALARSIEFAVVVAAPASVAILVADLGLGLAARAVPRVAVFFVAMPLRAVLGLVATFATIGLVLGESTERAIQAVAEGARLLR